MRHKQNPLLEKIAESSGVPPITIYRNSKQILELLSK